MKISKPKNGTFGFQGHGRSVDFWGSQEFAILLKRSLSNMVKELFGHFSLKNCHISRKKFMKWRSFLADLV